MDKSWYLIRYTGSREIMDFPPGGSIVVALPVHWDLKGQWVDIGADIAKALLQDLLLYHKKWLDNLFQTGGDLKVIGITQLGEDGEEYVTRPSEESYELNINEVLVFEWAKLYSKRAKNIRNERKASLAGLVSGGWQ